METLPAGASVLHPVRLLTASTYHTERAVVFGLSFAAPWIRKLRPYENRAEGEAVPDALLCPLLSHNYGRQFISWGT